jgi:hypothetical protein
MAQQQAIPFFVKAYDGRQCVVDHHRRGTRVLKMHFEPTSNPATWLDTCGASHPKRYII